ncbi:protein trichome birefringence-like 5 [Selaginella moellendorffii]|nr:protein trichome birefringence-like 5 [Selaginella moellendorffii]|eukprot:XP_002981501.2 protein trichome birefringence-like 5 [Selaginella moellendorffii]
MKFSPWGSIAVAVSFAVLVLAASSFLSSTSGDLLSRRLSMPRAANAAFLTAWLSRGDRDGDGEGGDRGVGGAGGGANPDDNPPLGNRGARAPKYFGSPSPSPSPSPAPAPSPSPSPSPAPAPSPSPPPPRSCDIYSGRWVRDDGYPLFQPSFCPFTDGAFQCQENGRNDSGYLHWRWQPHSCDLPRFNATDMMERLRNKTLAFVGDSLGRNQWESLVCMLYQAARNKRNVYEAHRQRVAKAGYYYSIVFADHRVHIDFYRSHFLVAENRRLPDKIKSAAANCTLSLDRLDPAAREWRSADLIVFNSGHWWEHRSIHSGECYFIQGSNYTTQMDGLAAFETSMKTWARWIDRHIGRTQKIFVRGYSPNHFSGGDWDTGGSCESHLEPLADEFKLDELSSKVDVFSRVLRSMKTRVTFLNVTKLSLFRKDGHVARWGKKHGWDQQDCSHWCLPGVPDTWNELLYASLVKQQQ